MTCEKHSQKTKSIYSATVTGNISISETFWRLHLSFSGHAAGAFAATVPGQFAEFDISGVSIPLDNQTPENLSDVAKKNILLRRPFSFADVTVVDKNTTTIDVLYCILGPATLRMKTLTAGDRVSVIGPLGNGFSFYDNKKYALLVAGGMGAPPIQHAAKHLKNEYPQTEAIAFAGAKTISDLPYFEIDPDKISAKPGDALKEFAVVGVKSIIATDDGSAGVKGFVTEAMEKWLADNKPGSQDCIIYACGPEPMLEAVAAIAKEHNIECQVSLERLMACGIGLCQSCAVEVVADGDDETAYKLCCKDGPVFNALEVAW